MISAYLDKADQVRFEQAMKKLVLVSEQPVEEIMRQQGRIFAVQAAQFTNRRGKSPAIGRQHKEDIKNTILSTYVDPKRIAKLISKVAGQKAGTRFQNYVRRRNIAGAQLMIDKIAAPHLDFQCKIGMFDKGSRHKRRLNGRMKTRLVVMDWRSVGQYVRSEVKKAGQLKHGWAMAAEMLGGTRGIPAYAKKGHKSRGYGAVKGRGGKAVLTVSNRSDYILENNSIGGLWRTRARNMERTTARMIRNRAKTITSRV